MKIVLMGYMGSGKTTVAKVLAKKNNIKFLDLDDYISEKERVSINVIFKNKGEIYFRSIENSYLSELLCNNKSFVLAVGGGTPCYANNIHLIKNNANSVYLKADIPTLISRLTNERQNRPLIAELNQEKLKEFVAKHLFERAPFYEKADCVISISGKSVNEIIDEIQTCVTITK